MNDKGWSSSTKLEEGIKRTYEWFLDNLDDFKQVKIKK
jgi:GDP-L-fucose synthase